MYLTSVSAFLTPPVCVAGSAADPEAIDWILKQPLLVWKFVPYSPVWNDRRARTGNRYRVALLPCLFVGHEKDDANYYHSEQPSLIFVAADNVFFWSAEYLLVWSFYHHQNPPHNRKSHTRRQSPTHLLFNPRF